MKMNSFSFKKKEEAKAPEEELKRSHHGTISLRYTIWLYFLLFITIILILLWLFQGVILQITYQYTKTRDIKNVTNTIFTEYNRENYEEILSKAAYDYNMCIEITDANGVSLYSFDMMANSCEIHGENHAKLAQYIKEIQSSENGVIYGQVFNKRFKNKTLLYVRRLGTMENPYGYIFLNTPVDMLDSTIAVLNEQLSYISVILIAIGGIISFFVARRISRPIVKITKSAEKLAQGDYNITFDGEGYDEAETLADTLNYASTEISKVDNLQRDLIANISHDLRTPLTMVKAYAEMIRDLSGDNPVKRNEHVNVIIEESNRLASLVNDILDLSKIQSGSQALLPEEFGISAKLAEILERYKLLSEQEGYQFVFEGDEEVTVRADILKIEQVIYNLINNAVNYTGADKRVIIRQINHDRYVRIEISDTGDGISEELLPLIFDRYYRAEKNKREVIGSGLGLSIVKAILKQHNFPFGVQSQVGKGSTFWFEISRIQEK